ncbi:MAG TPA: hypothetical protein VFE58_19005, partial [Tepidisphaeraceae bacterium]|nr:hypothetical protein [Tepidisphaeraceae bacterium]
MKSLWAVVVCVMVLAGGVARGEKVLVDQDFNGAKLPGGWKDNRSAEDGAKYEKVMADQVAALRVVTVKGQVHVTYALPADVGAGDAYYRLAINGRSVTRGVIQVGLRVQGARKMAWSGRMELVEVMSEQSMTFEMGKQPGGLVLTMTLPTAGSVDLAHVKLVQITREEMVEQMKAQYPKGGTTQNLLRVSRFPQGVQSGGAIGRDRSDEDYEVAGDMNVTGPSEAPALRIKCAKGVRFLLPPAEVRWTFMKHTASVYVRGHGSGALSVMADGVGVGAQGFTVNSDQWQRVVLTFEPGLMAREHQLVLDCSGEVWVDAFQLEPGEKATDYVTRPEVSLAFPKTDASVARIQFDDDPAIINFMVTGGGDNALNTKVYDIYGEERQLTDIALSGEEISTGSLQYELFMGHSYGVFRIEAWVEDQTGKRISPMSEIVILRVPRARDWDDDAMDSPFGVHLGPVHRQMVIAKAVGMNWVRLHDAGVEATAWASVEPVKGEWHWRDDEVKRYRDHHLMLLGTLQQSPGWASGYGKPTDDYWLHYLEPVDMAAWGEYVTKTTGHYKDSIQAWDIWNEPWNRFWSVWDAKKNEAVRSPTAGEDYAKLEKATFVAAKAVNPTFRLAGLNSTGGTHGKGWTKEVAAADGLSGCDLYSYHSYSNEMAGFPGDVAERHFQDALGPAIQKLGGKLDKPVWMTEGTGANGAITRGFYHYSAPGEDAEDAMEVADRLVRYEVSTLAQGAAKVFLYSMNVGGEFRPGAGEYQSLVTDDGFPEPSAAAHAVMAWHLEGKHFVKRIELAKGVYASIFEGENHSVAVITSAVTYGKYVLPGDVIALDVRDLFGNDVPDKTVFDGRTTYVDVQGSEGDLEKALVHQGVKRATTRGS